MRVDLHRLIASPGEKLDFDFELDADGLTFEGLLRFTSPVRAAGVIVNHAGHITLTGAIEADMLCQCARCLKEFPRHLRREMAAYLTEELVDEDNEDYYLLKDGVADLEEIARDTLILNFEPRLLCKDDCKGLCPKCGKDLNEGPCDCGEDPDPRMAALRQLLEKE